MVTLQWDEISFSDHQSIKITPLLAITGRKSKSFIEWVNLNQIQLPIPESCSAEHEEFKTTQLFEN